jgi:hypothetical protein
LNSPEQIIHVWANRHSSRGLKKPQLVFAQTKEHI